MASYTPFTSSRLDWRGSIYLVLTVLLALAASSVPPVPLLVSAQEAPLAPSLPASAFPLITWENDQIRPAIAYSPPTDQYLVAWEAGFFQSQGRVTPSKAKALATEEP